MDLSTEFQFTDKQTIEKEEFDDVVAYSRFLLSQNIKITKERQRITTLILDMMCKEDEDIMKSRDGITAKVIPGLSRSLSSFSEEEKKDLKKWAVEKHPEILVPHHAKFLTLIQDNPDIELPIPIGNSGLTLRITQGKPTEYEEKPKSITKMKRRQVPLSKPEDINPVTEGWSKPEQKNEIKRPEKTNREIRQERIERLADMQDMWDDGMTYAQIARANRLSATYTKKLLKPYEKERIMELRKKAVVFNEPLKSNKPPLYSVKV